MSGPGRSAPREGSRRNRAAEDPDARVRLEDLTLARPARGSVEVRVALRWWEGESFVARVAGPDSDMGLMQSAAQATARALELAVGERIRLEVIGVETVEAFDALLVVVGLASGLAEDPRRLVGSCAVKGEPADAAARAVLSATNRLVGSNLIYLR